MTKIKLKLPKSYYHKLNDDAHNFYLTLNKLCNMIFYKTNILKLKNHNFKLKPEENHSFSFNLNIKEELRYNKLGDEKYNIFNGNSLIKLTEEENNNLNKIFETNASFFQTVLLNYLNMDLSPDREKFLFEDHYKVILKAIETQKKIKILYKDTYRIIEPYFIKTDKDHPYNSIYSYCYKNKGYVTYLLSRIKKIELVNETWKQYDEKSIKAKSINFERYETENKIESILIKFNEYGFKRFERESNNRPNNYAKIRKNQLEDLKIKYPDLQEVKLQKDECLYEFKTSIKKIELYFPQFLNNFEVLHPISLREHFKEKFLEAYEKHKL